MKSVKPKKHLGQHFLKDVSIARQIVSFLGDSDTDQLIEIGPGTGVLTQFLIDRDNFQAWDVDVESVEFLREQYPLYADKVMLLDFLREPLEGEQIKIIGNLPYNISSQIFFKVFESREQVQEVVCMIQKEVAQRIASKEGSKVYGILSVLLQAFYDIDYLLTVKPGVFIPPPKVDSAVIQLRRNDVVQLDCDEKLFKRVIKMAFGKRRKTLRNALKELNLSTDLTDQPVFNLRAEQLSVSAFIQLTKQISESWK